MEASRSPIEADRKVMVVDRFDTAEAESAASLLKTIEEPPATVVFVLLAEEVPAEHVTIASRCVRVDLPPLADEVVVAALVADGVGPERAAHLAGASAGSLDRARLLADDPTLQGRRDAWWSVPDRIDGTGATVAVLVEELRAMIDGGQQILTARHEQEVADMAEQEKSLGTRGVGTTPTGGAAATRGSTLSRRRTPLRPGDVGPSLSGPGAGRPDLGDGCHGPDHRGRRGVAQEPQRGVAVAGAVPGPACRFVDREIALQPSGVT